MLPLGPDRPHRRIAALDALRGFALCGIIFINIPHCCPGCSRSDSPRRSVGMGVAAVAVWGLGVWLVTLPSPKLAQIRLGLTVSLATA
ncbi:hypothetical protein [Nonomuraea sp. KM88]|uniref:hypothetical protein n=1 Tax=Nonomuraea sp. KM88 TaxID=3457427 RepID=UPI003FCDE672